MKVKQATPTATVEKPIKRLVAKETFSVAAMIQLFIDEPAMEFSDYAAHFGHGVGWFTAVLAGDQFQAALDLRRHEVNNPAITATMVERYQGLALQGLDALKTALNNPKVQDATVLKALELSTKALGFGQKGNMEGEGKKEVQSLEDLSTNLLKVLHSKGAGNGMIPKPLKNIEPVEFDDIVGD